MKVFIATILILAVNCLTAFAAPEISRQPSSDKLPNYRLTNQLTTETIAGPKWAHSLPIYEVDLDRYQFPNGAAFREFENHLSVLKEMGIGIVWFMPLHPRGAKKSFGTPYAVRDYFTVNPKLGTLGEFRHLVKRAHQLGLHVLMDWVPNHTSWDNTLLDAHPEFYQHKNGEIQHAGPWPEMAQLDYSNRELWRYQANAMQYWLRECDVDGFRADVASNVPLAFWQWLRPQLEAVKPVFLLAEANDPRLHPAFDMTYDWELPPLLWEIAAGHKPATAIDDVLRQQARDYPRGAIRMRFLDNHDWHNEPNPWSGSPPKQKVEGDSVLQRYGQAQKAMMVLCATLPGKPLLYNGQEMGLTKSDPPRLASMRRNSALWSFYRSLYHCYQSHPALYRGDFLKIATAHDEDIYAFERQQGKDKVLVVLNLSPRPQSVVLEQTLTGACSELFSSRRQHFSGRAQLQMSPWDYLIFLKI